MASFRAAGAGPWLSIWTQPRATIRKIVDSDPVRLVLVLAGAGGLWVQLYTAVGQRWGDGLSAPAILVFVLILGPLRGILRLYIFGWVLKLTASKLDRSASSVEIRAAIAWSNVPLLLALVLWIPQLALFRSEMFTMETPNMDANPWLWNLRFALVLIEGFLFLWSLILFLKCLGEVQGVSAWKALGNVVVAYVVLAVPLLLFLVYVLEPFLDLILKLADAALPRLRGGVSTGVLGAYLERRQGLGVLH